MSKLEQAYIDKVNDYLNTPVDEREIIMGAGLMLQGNRNRVLHANVVRKTNHAKVESELRRIIGSNYIEYAKPLTDVEETNINEIVETQATVFSETGEFKGKRADHDTLPENIKAIPVENSDLYKKLRSLHEKLKLMSTEKFTAVEREEVLTEFAATDVKLRDNWYLYDTFSLDANTEDKGGAGVQIDENVKIDAKRINSNRTYLSRFSNETEIKPERLAEAQNRFNELIANGIEISAILVEKLKEHGILTEIEVSAEKSNSEEILPGAESGANA